VSKATHATTDNPAPTPTVGVNPISGVSVELELIVDEPVLVVPTGHPPHDLSNL